jgi:hypothetical protein
MMSRLKRFNEIDAIKALKKGLESGRWTLDDLDHAPPGTAMNLAEFHRHPMAQNYTGKFPEYRNLLRESSDSEDIPEDDFIL